MDSSTSQTSADDVNAIKSNHNCVCRELFELVEKQRIQLNQKDKELQENRQANEELLANKELEKAQAIEAATYQLDTELANAQQTILTFQMATWKSLTSADLCYYIKVPLIGGGYGGFLHHYDSTYLCSTVGLPASSPHAARFKFTKNSDGTIYIYSTLNGKYLAVESNSFQSAAAVIFSTSHWKFVLHYNYEPSKQTGILVDIYSLANGFFLSVGHPLTVTQNRVMANSRTVPDLKFLLVPVE